MTIMNLADSFLRGEYPLLQSTLLVILFLLFLFLFRRSFIKDIIEKAGLATKDDIKQSEERLNGKISSLEERLNGKISILDGKISSLEERLNGKISSLEEQMNTQLTLIRENDLFHTNKAILLSSKHLAEREPQLFERIKDTILETTPDHKREDIRTI